MNNKDKQIVLNLILNKISKKKFLKQFSVNIETKENYLNDLLQEAYESKDSESVEYSLAIYWSFSYSGECISILNRLLAVDWHYSHEDIALILQKKQDPYSTNVLYKTALTKFQYLEINNSEALARKCIYALGAINTVDSRKYLVDIANSDDEVVSEFAKHQLKKIGYSDLIPI